MSLRGHVAKDGLQSAVFSAHGSKSWTEVDMATFHVHFWAGSPPVQAPDASTTMSRIRGHASGVSGPPVPGPVSQHVRRDEVTAEQRAHLGNFEPRRGRSRSRRRRRRRSPEGDFPRRPVQFRPQRGCEPAPTFQPPGNLQSSVPITGPPGYFESGVPTTRPPGDLRSLAGGAAAVPLPLRPTLLTRQRHALHMSMPQGPDSNEPEVPPGDFRQLFPRPGVPPQHRTAHAQRVYVPSPQWRPNLVTPQPAQRAPDVPSRSHTVSKDCFKPGGQSAPAAATAMERPGLDPLQICVTEVVPQDADRPITAEQFFHRLIMRQRASPLSNFWVLPLTIEEMVSQSARRRWLASVTEAEPSKESVQAIAANLLAGVGQMNQQLHMSSARLQVLATAAAAAGVDPNAVFGKPLFVFKSARNVLVYSWQLRRFPGEREIDNHAYAAGEYSIHFLHFTTPHGLTGILRSGILLPSSREAMGMAAPKMPPLGFFGKGQLDSNPQSATDAASFVAENADHGKAGWSIAVTGQLAGTHVKFRRSNTEAEQRMLTRNICVRSSSSDGRWLFRPCPDLCIWSKT